MSTPRIRPVPRPRRVYWIQRPNQEDIVVFDGGYWGGDIHFYEHKETISTAEVEKEMKAELQKEDLPEHILAELVNFWLEKKYGRTFYWELKG